MIRSIILTALMLCALSAHAEPSPHVLPGELLSACEALRAEVGSDPHARERVIAAGRGRAVFCNACHGPDGNAQRPEYPSLAGQNPAYVANVLQQYRRGESPRGPSAMFGVASALSEADVEAVAHYIAALR
jgi:cytochrome c553